jgi:hypothetical protein
MNPLKMRNSIFLSILFLLSSCSANYYLKRSQKLERRAIEMGANVTHDTVYVDRQVIVPERHFDTLVQNVNFTDTIFVTKDNVVTKIKINEREKTVYVNTVCPPDTVRLRIPVEVIKNIETGNNSLLWILVAIVAGVAIISFIYRK